jgi:hypothetical protein
MGRPTMGRSMRVKEVNVWMRDDVIKALRFKAASCVAQEKRCNDIADRIKSGDILIVHNPDRNDMMARAEVMHRCGVGGSTQGDQQA